MNNENSRKIKLLKLWELLQRETDENHPMKLCKHCHKVFIAKKPDAEFCSTKCRNSFQKK